MQAQLQDQVTDTQFEPAKVFKFRGKEVKVGRTISPLKTMIYGENGIGKTEFASKPETSIIMDCEGNCGHIERAKPEETLKSMDECQEFINDLLRQDHDHKYLVVDSLDAIETLMSEKINSLYTAQQLSYGRSKEIWAKHIKEFIDSLDRLIVNKKMNITFTAHSRIKQVNNPMTEPYDRYDLRLNEAMRTGFCNWVHCILFATKEVIFEERKETGFSKKKAKGIERRVLYTRGDPTYYGKNVFNLPPKIRLDHQEFITHVKNFYNN